jgi:hypothetical protein
MEMNRNWLARYRAGRREEVWHELRQLGAAVHEPEIRAQAQLVCDEMALRARHNIEVIVERLTRDGFRFHTNDDEQTPRTPHIPPTPTAAQHADWLEQRFGPVPLTLLSWVRLVGDVWLVGTHPEWPESASADPLVIQVEGSHYPDYPIQKHFTDEWEQWRKYPEKHPESRPFILDLAPDRLHKENVSGGAPYGMRLPDACADGLFRAEASMPFVEYLNWVFRRGGFPHYTGDSTKEWEVTYKRAEDLLRL